VLHGRCDRVFVSLNILTSWIPERRRRVKAKNRRHSARRLSENVHLRRYPHSSSLRRTGKYASFLRICACGLKRDGCLASEHFPTASQNGVLQQAPSLFYKGRGLQRPWVLIKIQRLCEDKGGLHCRYRRKNGFGSLYEGGNAFLCGLSFSPMVVRRLS